MFSRKNLLLLPLKCSSNIVIQRVRKVKLNIADILIYQSHASIIARYRAHAHDSLPAALQAPRGQALSGSARCCADSYGEALPYNRQHEEA
jgi:hypothetical protein